MKDYLASVIRDSKSPVAARSAAREYLQARMLQSLQRMGAMIPVAFHGGTALRFLYSVPRFSEDLDFALERPDAPYDFRGWLEAVRSDFAAEGYGVEIKVSDRKTVHSAFVRFGGLLYEMGLSPHADEVISVKIEVDTIPPVGAGLTTTVVRRHVVLRLQHHDRASLLAGKLHAILQRPYTKGRDLYDLAWYLSAPDWPEPNLVQLNNALEQTRWDGPTLDPGNWREILGRRLVQVDWPSAVGDVRPFLDDQRDADLLNETDIGRLLGH